MNCSNCGEAMQVRSYEGVQIDECPSCGAVWLDQGELGQIIKATDATFSEGEKIAAIEAKGSDHREGKTFPCPKCSKTMETYQYAYNSGVFIDHCPAKHGVWLDNGELVKIQVVMEEFELRSGRHPAQKDGQKPEVALKRCPRDGSQLQEVRYESAKVDLCHKCGGVWCDDDELRDIVSDRGKAFTGADHADIVAHESRATVSRDSDLVTALDCVTCKKPMRRSNYSYSSGIIIDRCMAGHGVWLDRDELEKIQVFAERWESRSDRTESQYGRALQRVGEQARADFEKTRKESWEKGRNHSLFGRFFKLIGL